MCKSLKYILYNFQIIWISQGQILIIQDQENLKMTYEQNKELNDSFQEMNEETSQRKSQKQISQFYGVYNQAFNSIGIQIDLDSLIDDFQDNNIIYSKNFYQKQFSLKIVNKSKNSQIVTVSASFSHFTFEISMLNFASKSESNELFLAGSGSYGSALVCKIPGIENQFVIKQTLYYFNLENFNKPNRDEIKKKLRKVIQEYCFYKLFSILKIGPRIQPYLGFDIIIYNDAIEFVMEKCQHAKTTFQILKEDLFPSLKLMHQLNMIHGDIKPQNIMWSPAHQKHVFIDFGLSMFLLESLGEKNLTAYFGTYEYSSGEMKKILESENIGYVDLYYNDLYGLEHSIRRIQQKIIIEHQICNLNPQPKRQYINFVLNIILIYLIYKRDLKGVKKFIQLHPHLSIIEQTGQALLSLELTHNLITISKELLKKYHIYGFLKEKIELYCNRKSLEGFKNSHKAQLYAERLFEILPKFEGSTNDMIAFFLIIFGEDTSPTAAYMKKIFKNSIIKNQPNSQIFWENLIKYTYNTYTNESDILDIFEIVKKKIGIEKWNKPLSPEFVVFQRAQQIALRVIQLYNINLYQKHTQLRRLSMQENKLAKYTSTEIRMFQKWMRKKENYDILKNQIKKISTIGSKALFQIHETIKNLMEQTFSYKKQGGFIELFYDYLNIGKNLVQAFYESYQNFERFIQKFQNFYPTKRTQTLLLLKFQYLIKSQKSFHSKEQVLKYLKFIKTSGNLCFNQRFYPQLYEKGIIMIKKLKPEIEWQIFMSKVNDSTDKFQRILSHHNQNCKFKVFYIICRSLLQYLQENERESLLSYFYDQIFGPLNSYHKLVLTIYDLKSYLSLLRLFALYIQNRDKLKHLVRKIQSYTGFLKTKNIPYGIKYIYIRILVCCKKITLSQKHQMLKSLINANRQDFEGKHLTTDLQEIIVDYVELACLYRADCNQEVTIMKKWFDNEENYNIKIIQKLYLIKCLGKVYAANQSKYYADYEQILFKLVKDSNISKDTNINFMAYSALKIFINIYLKGGNPANTYTSIKRLYKIIEESYRSLRYEFFHKYSNFIVLIQTIFREMFWFEFISSLPQSLFQDLQSLPNPFENCENLLKKASYWIPHCGFYFQRGFRLKMNIWMFQYAERKIFQIKSKRKLDLFKLRSFRNCLYKNSKKLINDIHTLFLKKNYSLNHSHIAAKINQKMVNNIQKWLQNKNEKVEITSQCNISCIVRKIYELSLNKDYAQRCWNDYQQAFMEEAIFFFTYQYFL